MQGAFQGVHRNRQAGSGRSSTLPPRDRLAKIAVASLFALVVAACSRSPQVSQAGADSLKRDLELAPLAADHPLNDTASAPAAPEPRTAAPAAKPTEKPRPTAHRAARPLPSAHTVAAPTPAPAASAAAPASTSAPAAQPAAELTLRSGTAIQAALQDSINSRRNHVGDVVEARVARDVMDSAGRVVIPSGARVQLTITDLAPAKGKGAADGKLALQVNTLMVNGQNYAVSAQVQPVHHQLRGRGISAGEAEKVGAGTAIGAIAGRIIGGNATGAVVGGVVGAAGGTAVAVETASRDVFVPAGTGVDLTLTSPLVVKPR